MMDFECRIQRGVLEGAATYLKHFGIRPALLDLRSQDRPGRFDQMGAYLLA